MQEGGRLTVETGHVTVCVADAGALEGLALGDYVDLVRDRHRQRHAAGGEGAGVRPLLTTKQLGQGTGLGLSMIYGFARQSGGHVTIESEVAKGTTVCMYLPRHAGPMPPETHVGDDVVPWTGVKPASFFYRGRDDRPQFRCRGAAEPWLRGRAGREWPLGVAILQSAQPIDLLVTDVGLPGMDGRAVADAARFSDRASRCCS